jgi:non-heme chloroperoxidase
MAPLQRFIRLAHGLRLHHAEQGDPGGFPVVMPHGITDSWRSFESVMAHLPGSLHVFAPSQREHGESGPSRPLRFARDLASFASTLASLAPSEETLQ